MSDQWDGIPLPEEWKTAMGRKLDPAVFAGVDLWAEEREAQAKVAHLREEMDALAARIIASLAGPAGAPDMPEGLPQVAHGEVLATDGAASEPPTTQAEAPAVPEVPHSGEQPTPADRRRLWDRRHAMLVTSLEAYLRAARMRMPYDAASHVQVELLADEWACLQLLKTLRDMKAPEVPVDHTLDQPSLEEAVEPEDGRPVHWRTMEGSMLHAVYNATRPPLTTRNADTVTCGTCLSYSGPWS